MSTASLAGRQAPTAPTALSVLAMLVMLLFGFGAMFMGFAGENLFVAALFALYATAAALAHAGYQLGWGIWLSIALLQLAPAALRGDLAVSLVACIQLLVLGSNSVRGYCQRQVGR